MWFEDMGWISPFSSIENEEIRSWAHCEHIRDEEIEARIHIEKDEELLKEEAQEEWKKAA